ncbi:MAG: YkgJ family cysteine cluster protein [Planctomycetes bacterium]|nr:YkgJ family cysteine cluster protein [Planctomycetota bacterium]
MAALKKLTVILKDSKGGESDSPARNAVWYSRGLRFRCTRCGNCCTGFPGFVWVDAESIGVIAAYLKLSVEGFSRRFVRRAGDRLSLVERDNYDCVFWDKDRGCTIYPVRPAQCRTFPFWPEHLAAEANWESVRDRCPGAGQGKRYSAEEIQRMLRQEAGT